MKVGEVVHIRLNPEDVLGCIDVCETSHVLTPGMSLAMVVRLALSGLLESARAAELIPRREGYEYHQMVAPLLQTGRNGKKLQISETIELAEVSRANNDLPASVVRLPRPVRAANGSGDTARDKFIRRHGARIDELNQKKEIDPDNWSEAEQAELIDLITRLNEQ